MEAVSVAVRVNCFQKTLWIVTAGLATCPACDMLLGCLLSRVMVAIIGMADIVTAEFTSSVRQMRQKYAH